MSASQDKVEEPGVNSAEGNHLQYATQSGAGTNWHCSVIEICDVGIIIFGKSGAGKTSLALGLIDHFVTRGKEAYLIADDQAVLNMRGKQLIACVPMPIAGLVEIRGFGIAKRDYKDNTKIRLAVTLEGDELVERMPQKQDISLLNLSIPHLKVPLRHEAQGIRIVSAWIDELDSDIDCANL